MRASTGSPGLRNGAVRRPLEERPSVILIAEAEKDDFSRRALPWLAALTFLAGVLAVSTGIVFERSEAVLPSGPIEVSLEAGTAAVSADGNAAAEVGSSSSPGLPLPMPGALPGVRPGQPAVFPDYRPRLQPIGIPGGSAGADLPQPSTDEVLADLPSSPSREPQSDAQIGWEQGRERKVLSRRDPQFPPMLGASGVEVECTARITVSPSGTVTHVEITRSSGYTEIDASVEAALREFLFSQVDGRKNAVGTVTFRFRLEKQD
ncbi:MAG: TonB family protein [Spirochaetia bacterium]